MNKKCFFLFACPCGSVVPSIPLTFAITLAGPWLPNKMGLCLNGGQMQIACDDKPVFFYYYYFGVPLSVWWNIAHSTQT